MADPTPTVKRYHVSYAGFHTSGARGASSVAEYFKRVKGEAAQYDQLVEKGWTVELYEAYSEGDASYDVHCTVEDPEVAVAEIEAIFGELDDEERAEILTIQEIVVGKTKPTVSDERFDAWLRTNTV